MKIDFVIETEDCIKGREIDEYCIDIWDYSMNVRRFKGNGPIDWEKFHKITKNRYKKGYDPGFGSENFTGWITFKNTSDWLERGTYDGSEWWEDRVRPSLSKIK